MMVSSGTRESCDSGESALDSTRLQLEPAFNEAEDKLPSISFGYYYGRNLQTMHASTMLMLSGCSGEGVVERVNGRTIERTFDMSDSLLLDPDQYNKQLGRGRLETSNFMHAFQKAASEKAASLSLCDGYPSVIALSLVEGEQGIDAITVCEDFEVYDGSSPDNPCVYSNVELLSGAMRHSVLSAPLNKSAFESATMPHSCSVQETTQQDDQRAISAAIELDAEQLLPATKSTKKQESKSAADEIESAPDEIESAPDEIESAPDEIDSAPDEIESTPDEIEIQFTDSTSMSLFRDCWNYPLSIALVFDD